MGCYLLVTLTDDILLFYLHLFMAPNDLESDMDSPYVGYALGRKTRKLSMLEGEHIYIYIYCVYVL